MEASPMIKALKKKYEAEVDVAKATIQVYLTKPVGIGEHPQIAEEIAKREAERPRKEFLKACIGSRHTAESAAVTGGRAKEGVKKSGSTCRSEWKELNNS